MLLLADIGQQVEVSQPVRPRAPVGADELVGDALERFVACGERSEALRRGQLLIRGVAVRGMRNLRFYCFGRNDFRIDGSVSSRAAPMRSRQ